MIEVKNLMHSYEKNNEYAVNDISFDIEKGEIFGFLGPSGAGKSTTQGILAGLLELQKGEIIIDGEARRGHPNKAFFNRIGVGFERPNVYKKLTALDNLKFHASLYDRETEDPMTVLEWVGLKDEAKKKAGAFSKGMMQRIGFARSMINKPDIWFLDEPTMGLDPSTANSIKSIIKRKQKEGTTIFLTTHNMFVADELCNRVAFIVEGKIVAMDTPKNLKLKHGKPTVTVEYLEDRELKSASMGMEEKDKKALEKFITEHDVKTIHSGEPTLEEIFIKLTGRGLE
ncbi:MAG: ABC transporter ATP-binding protein [Candidatus Neomarinimicrobiota bacterium]|nr:MAG: ABC transporter ATP-binding protein [Candidatus Neomarinimicrobiota bacterium]